MKIAVIGAGVAGMHAANDLAKNGHQVTLYDKAPFIGGLAHYYEFDGTYLEKFYHFIMTADVEYLEFMEDVGVSKDSLNWINTKTDFYADGKMYPFSTPKDLLKFGAIPFFSRIRFAATMAYLTYVATNWRKLEKKNCREWLRKMCGARAYDVIWESNLRMKFGTLLEEMRMPWVWARSRMVRQYRDVESGSSDEKRAWIKGSTKTMLDAAEKTMTERGVNIRTGVEIEEICWDKSQENGGGVQGVRLKGEEMEDFDRVLYSAPNYELDKMLPGTKELEGEAHEYFETIRRQRYFGVVCVVMALKKNISPSFWTYVNDKRVPFVGVINYSPFMDYEGHKDHHVIYIPAYCTTEEEPYTTDDAKILADYKAGLKVMWPDFEDNWVKEEKVFRVPNASMIVTGEYSKELVPLKSPIPGFFLGNLSQIYPQDRGISISMKLAKYAVEAVENDKDVEMRFEPY